MCKPDRSDFVNGPDGHAAQRAFTLVEMLVVMAIIAIVAAIALPAVSSIQGSYNLDSVGQSVAAQLNLARQNAIASSRPVQVRFYQIADYNGSTTPLVYRAMQTFIEGATTTSATSVNGTITLSGSNTTTVVTSISKPYFFPRPVVCLTTTANSTDNSSLLDYNSIQYNGIQNVPAGDTANPLVSPYGAAAYTYFRFRSNGQVDQSITTVSSTGGTTTWTYGTLTLAMENAKNVGTTGLPANYVTVQLNAVTGAVRVFRP